jgi:hypothetical protein
MSALSLERRARDPRFEALAELVQDDWVRVEAVWDELRRGRGIHLRPDTELQAEGIRGFLYEALIEASHRNLLGLFATRLVKAGLADGSFVRKLDCVLPPGTAQLQSFVDGQFRPVSALIAGRGLLLAIDHVCRIDIDGEKGVGTGVLVRPTLVATAAHVIKDLLLRDEEGRFGLRPDGSLVAARGSISRITLTFGDVEDYLPAVDGQDAAAKPVRRSGEEAPLHDSWLAWGSPGTLIEFSTAYDVRDITDIDSLKGPWDLALLRLATARPLPRSNLLPTRPPRKPFQVNLLHHPNGGTGSGMPLMWSVGSLDDQLGAPDQPAVRLLHNANTSGGSSGCPVYDRQWRIVAIHQGGERQAASLSDAGRLASQLRNRAVPVLPWCPRLDAFERSDVPYLRDLATAPDGSPGPYPVIGRRLTQQWAWRSSWPDAAAVDRLLVVRGAPGTGRRFTKHLIRGLVTPLGGRVAALDLANAVHNGAAGFARRCLQAIAPDVPLPTLDEGLTTSQRDLRDELVPALARQVTRLSDGWVVWLVIEGFDAAGSEPPAVVRDFVLTLVRQLAQVPALRLVLVGWTEAPPRGFETCVEQLTGPTGEDVARRLVPPGDEPPAELVTGLGGALAALLATGLAPYDAARTLMAGAVSGAQAQPAAGGGE